MFVHCAVFKCFQLGEEGEDGGRSSRARLEKTELGNIHQELLTEVQLRKKHIPRKAQKTPETTGLTQLPQAAS